MRNGEAKTGTRSHDTGGRQVARVRWPLARTSRVIASHQRAGDTASETPVGGIIQPHDRLSVIVLAFLSTRRGGGSLAFALLNFGPGAGFPVDEVLKNPL